MPKKSPSKRRKKKPVADWSWVAPVFLGVLTITALRVVAQFYSRADLFVDESQYWFWGQKLAFGYYSKPPMIGWVIRGVTELAGSEAPFWVRLPAPILHGITAVILAAIAARLQSATAAIVVGLGYITLPIIAVGSFLISTDTIMFPFLAGALLVYVMDLEAPTRAKALSTGVLLGLAFLSKYAAVYYVLCACLAAAVVKEWRPNLKQVGVILAAFLIVVSPNLIWNLLNGFTTLQHTLDNADWVRDPQNRTSFNPISLAEFFASQFIVFGPVLFIALLVLGYKAFRYETAPWVRACLLFTLPIIFIVCVQALLSEAYANWAAAAYLAGSVAVLSWLLDLRKIWLWLSFVINGSICLALPVLGLLADEVRIGNDRLLLGRYVGLDEMSQAIFDDADERGLDVIVAGNRDILADLFYSGRDVGVSIYAIPRPGRPAHHYALKHTYPLSKGVEVERILVVERTGTVLPCDATLVRTVTPKEGGHRDRSFEFFDAPSTCWD